MTPKEKAKELVDKCFDLIYTSNAHYAEVDAPQNCALLAVENEYNSLREQLFNLRATGVIESEKVYLFRLDELISQQSEIEIEIYKL